MSYRTGLRAISRLTLLLPPVRRSSVHPCPSSPASACGIVGGGGLVSDLETPLFPREPPRMAVSPGNLNVVGKGQNFSAGDCFQSQNTVLQGQPFGGIPTVLCLNVILWVVSPGHGGGQTDRSHPGGGRCNLPKWYRRAPLPMEASHSGGNHLSASPARGSPGG